MTRARLFVAAGRLLLGSKRLTALLADLGLAKHPYDIRTAHLSSKYEGEVRRLRLVDEFTPQIPYNVFTGKRDGAKMKLLGPTLDPVVATPQKDKDAINITKLPKTYVGDKDRKDWANQRYWRGPEATPPQSALDSMLFV